MVVEAEIKMRIRTKKGGCQSSRREIKVRGSLIDFEWTLFPLEKGLLAIKRISTSVSERF